MKKVTVFEIIQNKKIADITYCLVMTGDCSCITAPGQFVNIALEGKYLRRPISVCSVHGNVLTLVYKVVGGGTRQMAEMQPGEKLEILTGLGNGFDTAESGENPVVIGGGVIGLEMACYFASVGVKVTVVEMMPKIAGPTDQEICDSLMKTYKKEGMEFKLSAKVLEVGSNSVKYEDAEGVHTIECDKVLLSTGRRANVQGLDLDVLGYLDPGITVNIIEGGRIVEKKHLDAPIQILPRILQSPVLPTLQKTKIFYSYRNYNPDIYSVSN